MNINTIMDYDSTKGEITLDREISKLDRFVMDFCSILEKHTKYVLVSGYISIVFGRSRATEDVDLLVPKMDFSRFSAMFKDFLKNGYECINTSYLEEAFDMLKEHAIRFCKKGSPLPNIEFKSITNDIQKHALENRINLKLKEKELFISPLELQIAYKMSLIAKGEISEISSDKDFEDAKHLYDLFEDKINKDELLYFMNYFKIPEIWRELLYE